MSLHARPVLICLPTGARQYPSVLVTTWHLMPLPDGAVLAGPAPRMVRHVPVALPEIGYTAHLRADADGEPENVPVSRLLEKLGHGQRVTGNVVLTPGLPGQECEGLTAAQACELTDALVRMVHVPTSIR